MSNAVAISFERVNKSFGWVRAAHDLSFEVREGEVFGFIGPNGAGKTTSIKMMVGLLRPESGQLRVAGHAMPKDKAQVHECIGYLSQHTAFQPWRTVRHVLQTFGRLSGIARLDLEPRIERVLEQVGLSDAASQRAVHLSGGQARRLGLAQAVLHEPRILILDEPLAGLDPANRMAVKSIIREHVGRGVTVLFSSHILSDVQDVATCVGILQRGRLVRAGSLATLRREFSVGQEVDVRLSHDPGQIAAVLAGLPGVVEVRAVEGAGEDGPDSDGSGRAEVGRYSVRLDVAHDTDDTIHALIQTLIERGARIRSLAPHTPSLDELYFQILADHERGRTDAGLDSGVDADAADARGALG